MFPIKVYFLSSLPSSTSLQQKLVQTKGLYKQINEMYPLVLTPNVGVMAIDGTYALGGLFSHLLQTEHTHSTYLFTLFPSEILEDTECGGRQPNLSVGRAPSSLG